MLEGERKELLMYSRYVDDLLIKVMRDQDAAAKEKLKQVQPRLDQLVLGKKLSQSEIDELIRGMGK